MGKVPKRATCRESQLTSVAILTNSNFAGTDAIISNVSKAKLIESGGHPS